MLLAGRNSRRVDERMDAEAKLTEERWKAHSHEHEQMERSLNEYKASSNEWRKLVSDFRATYLPEAVFDTEQRALRTQMETADKDAERRLKVLEDAALRTEGSHQFLTNTRLALLMVFSTIGTTVAVISLFEAFTHHT